MLTSQRKKMGRLGATAKNRLHAVLHRHHILPPEGFELFHPKLRHYWEWLKVSAMEKVCIQSDLATLEFAQQQKAMLEEEMGKVAANDQRVPLLIQVPGVAMLSAVTILAAIGTVIRFPEARFLVGYAGLGARVHDSGERRTTGGITKMGRRDLRGVIIDAANAAVRHHPFWKKEFERLELAGQPDKKDVPVTEDERRRILDLTEKLAEPELSAEARLVIVAQIRLELLGEKEGFSIVTPVNGTFLHLKQERPPPFTVSIEAFSV